MGSGSLRVARLASADVERMGRNTPIKLVAAAGAPFARAAIRQARIIEKLLPRVLTGDSPRAIHNFRIATRRLETILECALIPNGVASTEVLSLLRRARRSYSAVRNADVLLQFSGKQLRVGNREAAAAWADFRAFLKARRARGRKKASRKVRELSLEQHCSRLRRQLKDGEAGLRAEPGDMGRQALTRGIISDTREAWFHLRKAGRRALSSRTTKAMHALRIAAKRFRYRLEVLRDARSAEADEILVRLKELQDNLGTWHDREILQEYLQDMLVNSHLCNGNWLQAQQVVNLALLLSTEKQALAKQCQETSAKTLEALSESALVTKGLLTPASGARHRAKSRSSPPARGTITEESPSTSPQR